MVLDASVVIAVLLEEPGHRELLKKLSSAPRVIIGAPTAWEAAMVLMARGGSRAAMLLDQMLHRLSVEVIPFTGEHYAVARTAFLRFGKGRHPAALNYGDCMVYAVASLSGFPLLFVGSDFAKTDLPAA